MVEVFIPNTKLVPKAAPCQQFLPGDSPTGAASYSAHPDSGRDAAWHFIRQHLGNTQEIKRWGTPSNSGSPVWGFDPCRDLTKHPGPAPLST